MGSSSFRARTPARVSREAWGVMSRPLSAPVNTGPTFAIVVWGTLRVRTLGRRQQAQRGGLLRRGLLSSELHPGHLERLHHRGICVTRPVLGRGTYPR